MSSPAEHNVPAASRGPGLVGELREPKGTMSFRSTRFEDAPPLELSGVLPRSLMPLS